MDGASTLPGLRGADHVGITVPDLEQAVDFFANVLGAEPFYPLGPFGDAEVGSAFNEVQFGVHAKAVVEGMRLLRLRNLNIELFQWSAPGQVKQPPKLSDNSTFELCLYVEDMDAAVAFLKAKGIEVLGDKLALTGPEAGPEATYQYFRTPWGALMELISYPNGRAYEAEYRPRKLWDPGTARIED